MAIQEDDDVKAASIDYDQLTPVQRERVHAAVRLMLDYLLDKAPFNRENGRRETGECQKATPPEEPVQLRLGI